MHFVYAIQNKINLKIYIGYSSGPEKRWAREKSASEHPKDYEYDSLLSRAIRKYKWENFTKNILENFDNQQDALDAEIFWIEFFKTNVCVYGTNYGYNRDVGGGLPPNHTGKIRSEWHKQRISETHKGQIISLKQREIVSESNKNRIITDETREKISKVQKGKIVSLETRNKISAAKKGKKLTEEHKRKLSEAKTRK